MNDHPDAPATDVEIRLGAVADAPAIADVHVRSFVATYRRLPRTVRAATAGLAARTDLWAGRMRDPGPTTTLVASRDGRLCGFVHLRPDPDLGDGDTRTGQVLSIHVDPELVGGGIGARLMSAAVVRLRAEEYRAATLWVVADNDKARGFYERFGWRADGSRRREVLAVAGEEGDEVEVVRYRIELDPGVPTSAGAET